MFIGHYAVAIAAKRWAPRTSLGTLLAAAVFLDLLWPVLVLTGAERVDIEPGHTAFMPLAFTSYPWSHSLLMSILWGLLFGGVHFVIRRQRTAAIMLGLLVISHWGLDVIVHRPDLPITPTGEARIGLGLWNSIPATLILELVMFAVAIRLYTSMTTARDKIGSLGWIGFLITLLGIYTGATFGPPPPSAAAIAWTDLGQFLLIAWAAWVDRHRATSRANFNNRHWVL